MGDLLELTADLSAAIAALRNADPARLAGGESIQALQRQLECLEAVTTRATAAFDASRDWEADGARSAAAWMSARCGLPTSTCRRRVKLGRQLRHMPAVEEAWLGGEVSHGHVELLAGARTTATTDAFERDEPMLVDLARQLTFRHFNKALAYWLQLADPDGVEERTDAQHEARRLHLSQSGDGMWFLDGCFDPISGAAFARALKRIEDELFQADWVAAKARVGDGVSANDLARKPAQLRADAAVEMARRSGAVPPGARLPEPLFTVFVGYETFAGRMCELADGTVISPGAAARWFDEAWVERVVFDGPDRVKNVGVRRRIFTGATRRAVQVRDRECFHEFCEVPAEDAQIDHIEPYAAGGLTIDDNGRAACGYHNRGRHRRR